MTWSLLSLQIQMRGQVFLNEDNDGLFNSLLEGMQLIKTS